MENRGNRADDSGHDKRAEAGDSIPLADRLGGRADGRGGLPGAGRRPVSLPAGAAQGTQASVTSLRAAVASATRAAEDIRRRSRGALAAVLLIAVSVTIGVVPASSTPTGGFEISDANITDGPLPAPDWGSIFGRTPSGVAGAPVSVKNTQGMIAPSFIEDTMVGSPLPSPPCLPGKKGDLTVFTGSGSDKNGDPLSTWTFQSGSIPPNKDDITNTYAAAKVDTDGHRLFYFGLERAANNGSGHVDLEFLQSPIGAEVTGADASGCPTGTFTGSRTVGDILVVLDLSKGGALGLQEVLLWDGDSYEAPAMSIDSLARVWHNETGQIACGDWNCRTPGPVVVNVLQPNTFVEGYIDTTALGVGSCFGGFNAKSRSSHEYNSELKDIAFGEFYTCDARISITPDGLNPVGTTHTFSAHVESNAGGVSYTNAPDGTLITFDIVSGPGSFTDGVSSCTTTGGTGSCSVSITSAVAGTTVVSATSELAVGPVTLRRSTNGSAGPGGSGNATKTWADGYIKVTPTAVNPVNEAHVFTVEYGVLPGGADSVTGVSITADVTPDPDGGEVNTCATPAQVATHVYQCTLTINSSQAGVFTATATGTATVARTGVAETVVVTRTTATGQHGPGGSTAAVKTYVDARITVGPDGLNAVDDPHTVTAVVETKDGNGPWSPAANGTTVSFVASGAGGLVGGADSCATSGGRCDVAIVSSSVGTTQVGASATVVVNGITLTRATGTAVNTAAGGSGPLTKRWVDASIQVVETAVNEVNDAHQFTVTVRAHRPGSETVSFRSVTPTVSPTPSSVASTCDTPVVSPDGLTATCLYTINSWSAAIFDVDATTVVDFSDGTYTASVTRSTGPDAGARSGPQGNDGATKTFVDARVSVGLDGVNNVGDPHTVTGRAEFNDGTGWRPAVGKTITYATTQGPGTFVNGVSSCVTGNDGRCAVRIVSSETGVQWVSASTRYAVLGLTLNRTTAVDGPTDPDNLRKEWVAATISISPSAVNEVGVPHQFTITARATSSGAPINFGSLTTTVSPAPGSKSDDCAGATPVVDGGTATLTCTLTINNPSAGVFTANAGVRVTIGTVAVDLATSGTGGSGAATKTYVDARITLSPDGVNEVGDPHPLEAHLQVDDGSGWADAPAGVVIALERLSGPGGLSAPTCTTDVFGRCTVVLNSGTAGVSIVGASATVDVLGETLTRSTTGNAGPGGSADVTKRWVDATISISPDGVNPVGAAHTFTVTATADPSGAAPVSFESVSVSVTPEPTSVSDTCDTPDVTGNSATCQVTINSTTPGVFAANATVVVTMGGVTVTRSTDSTVAPAGPGGSGPATKTYVDADIQIGEDGVNAVGDPHPVTGHVDVDPGTGVQNAPDGTVITFAVVSGPGSLSPTSCETAGGTGSCTVTLNSSVAGVTVVSAASTVSVGGVDLDLVTSGTGGSSGNLTKRWVDASVTVTPSATNPLNEAHLFTVTATAIPSGADPVTFDSITTSVTPEPGSTSSTCDTPEVVGNVATCTLTVNSSVATVLTAHATVEVTIGGVTLTRSTDSGVAAAGPGGSGPATKTYVDAGITIGRDGVNAVGDPHPVTGHVDVDPGTGRQNAPDGTPISFAIVSGPGRLSASSCTTSGSTGSCTVSLVSSEAGVTVVRATSRVTLGGVVLDLATGGRGGGSPDLTKRWVDALITIGPSAINPLNLAHVFDVTVKAIPSGGGPVVFDSITTTVRPAPGRVDSTCATPTVVGDEARCTLTINSAVEGTFVADATARLHVGPASLTRSTDRSVAPSGPGGGASATKIYQAGIVAPQVLGVSLSLPVTGLEIRRLLFSGLATVVFGVGLMMASRRRRPGRA